jgi:hypothetical protein
MKQTILLLSTLFFITLAAGAQERHHRKPFPPRKQFATTDDGVRVVLYADGTWSIAPHQSMPRKKLTSEIRGSYLYLYHRGEEIDRVRVQENTYYDSNCRCYKGSIVFGAALYTFHGKDNTVAFLGDEVIGKASRFEDAVSMAAYHFTDEVYDGLTPELRGSYLHVFREGKEIDKIRMRHQSWYDGSKRCYMASTSFGSATYGYDGCDDSVRFLGKQTVGYAFSDDDARFVAAFHFLGQQFGGCGEGN